MESQKESDDKNSIIESAAEKFARLFICQIESEQKPIKIKKTNENTRQT
jgi:hypothetical protein